MAQRMRANDVTRVLLIDDDAELTALLAEYLQQEGFQVESENDSRAAPGRIGAGGFDIVVLDIMMPFVNGIELLRRLCRDHDLPVLMLTARGDEVDRIAGLNLGADDYVAKPCSPGELAARLRAILRRSGRASGAGETGGAIRAGPLQIDPATRRASWEGAPLDLTGAEFNLLEVLARNAGEVVPRADLSLNALGRELTPFDRSIDVHVSSIRQKLGRQGDGQSRIRNVRGVGYQLVTGG